jgi:hypothetical protein
MPGAEGRCGENGICSATELIEGELIKRTTEAAIAHYMDQACTEVIFRAKTKINREEFHKPRKFKQMLRDEAREIAQQGIPVTPEDWSGGCPLFAHSFLDTIKRLFYVHPPCQKAIFYQV